MTGPELFALLGNVGSPVLLLVAGIVLLAQFVSERIAKILGPLGKIGRLWHTREERAEADAQALYRARRTALEEVAADQLADLTTQLGYFRQRMDELREENAALRTELRTVHTLLDSATRKLQQIDDKIDTAEQRAIGLQPPPPRIRRHAAPDTDPQTQRIPPAI